ncbi:MAG: hypothetical protein ACFFDQ_04180, partial [Candidatus Thorarchaeota archaeon]
MVAYDELMRKAREYILLKTVKYLVKWDYETYMPPKGLILRSDQLSVIEQLIHRMKVDAEIGRLLEEIERAARTLNEVQKRNVFKIR